MSDLNLKTFDKLYPMIIHKYDELFDDQNANIMDRINTIVNYLNQVGKLTNDVVKDWNVVYQWVMNDGLTTDVNNKIEAMKANGELNQILQNIFNSLTGDMTTLHTTAKDTLVNSINEVDDLAKANQTHIGDLTTLTTADKDTIVHAINDNTTQLAQIATNLNLAFPKLAGETDDTARINRALASQKPVLFPKQDYLVSGTIKPNQNGWIYFVKGARLLFSPSGTYDHMIQYPSTDLGLVTLFDTKYLGGTIVQNIDIWASQDNGTTKVANACGIAPSIEFMGNESDAVLNTNNKFINPKVHFAVWGIHFHSSVQSTWGASTGNRFEQIECYSCANGVLFGQNQDDITIDGLRVLSATGYGFYRQGRGINSNGVFLSLVGGNGTGLWIDSSTTSCVINALFIESTDGTACTPIRMTGNQNYFADLIVNGLSVNVPDGSPWIVFDGSWYDHVSIKGCVDKNWNISRPNTSLVNVKGYASGQIVNNYCEIEYQGSSYASIITYALTSSTDNANNTSRIKIICSDSIVEYIGITNYSGGKEPTIPVTFANGFTNYGSGYSNVGYYKDLNGVVHLEGIAKAGATVTSGTVIFQLPTKYCPLTNKIFVSDADTGFAKIEVDTNGNVTISNSTITANTGYITLDGISFRAA